MFFHGEAERARKPFQVCQIIKLSRQTPSFSQADKGMQGLPGPWLCLGLRPSTHFPQACLITLMCEMLVSSVHRLAGDPQPKLHTPHTINPTLLLK